ncbi:MAG TPA: hypothetical protein VNZ45_15650, partial [Bacteroidia bacterium]|nr:hypothetical protein [Bacteroidia bacterium]
MQAVLSLKDKVLSSTGISSTGSTSTEVNDLALDNGFYAEVGVPVISNFLPKRRKRLNLLSLLRKPVVTAVTLAVASLFFAGTASAHHNNITSASLGTQSVAAYAGTGS